MKLPQRPLGHPNTLLRAPKPTLIPRTPAIVPRQEQSHRYVYEQRTQPTTLRRTRTQLVGRGGQQVPE